MNIITKTSAILFFIFYVVQINNAQTTQNINVLFVNEDGNHVADRAIRAVLEYVQRHKDLGIEVALETVSGNRTDAKGLLESLCSKYSELITKKKPPHVLLDTTMTGVSSETVKSFSAALGLPTVSGSFGQEGDLRLWRSLNPNQQNFLLQVMPPADIIPEAIRSIVNNQNITNAAVLFDDSFVMDHKYKSLFQNIPTRHIITAAETGSDKIIAQLKKIRELDIANFFILGSLATIKNVLDAANNDENYFQKKFAWHAITQDRGELKCACRNATILYLKPSPDAASRDRLGRIKTAHSLNEEPEIASAFYFDLSLRTFLAVKDVLSAGSWPKEMPYLTCDEYDGKNSPERIIDLKSSFIKVSEPPTYGPFEFEKPFNGHSHIKFTMDLSAVSVREGASVSTSALGSWDAGLDNPLVVNNDEVMTNYTAAIVHRIVTVVQHPFMIRDSASPKGYKGYCIDLIDEIRSVVNFDYEIIEAPDGKFGNMDEKGNWNGIVKELIEKRADIGLGSMSVMAERENVIDFTVPYYDLVGITILMKLPKTPTSLFKFLTVLENEVWLCILASYFFTSFLMWVFDRWSPYSYQNNREKYKDDEEKREFNLKECLWFCMTSLTPQGGGEAPKNLSGRLVAATWWLFGFIIIASYTANLAAFLTVSRLDTPVESLDDLSKQYKILYAPLNGSSAMTYFKRMADIEDRFYEIWKDMSLNDSLSEVERSKLAVWDYPVSDKYTKMWQAMQEAKLPETMDEAIQRVRESKSSSVGFAFLGDATDIRYQVLTNCDLQMVGEEFSRKPYAIAVQQGSPLKDQFNNAILQLLNRRQLEKLKEQWWNNNKEKMTCEKPEDQSDGISIQNIGGVFIVIFIGIGLACITLVFEYWWYKYRKNPKVIDVMEAPASKEKTSVKIPDNEINDPNSIFRSRYQYPPANFRSRF